VFQLQIKITDVVNITEVTEVTSLIGDIWRMQSPTCNIQAYLWLIWKDYLCHRRIGI